MDVLLFTALIAAYIWIIEPWTGPGRPLYGPVILAGLGFAGASLRRHGATWKRIGFRSDNLLPALLVYVLASVTLAGAVLWWYREFVIWPEWGPRYLLRWMLYVAWGLVQQFCLLSFLLTRLREITRRDLCAVLAATAIFALLHLPNPFLAVYTVFGGLVSTALFLRWPNVFAAAIGHATAACIVNFLIPLEVFGSMWVGPMYWAASGDIPL